MLLLGMYVEGLTLKQLSGPAGLDPSTTFYRLKKTHAALRSNIETFLKEQLRMSPSECESLVRSMLSHLDLRVKSLFSPDSR